MEIYYLYTLFRNSAPKWNSMRVLNKCLGCQNMTEQHPHPPLSAVSHWWHRHFSGRAHTVQPASLIGRKYKEIWEREMLCCGCIFTLGKSSNAFRETFNYLSSSMTEQGVVFDRGVINRILIQTIKCPTCELTAGAWVGSQLTDRWHAVWECFRHSRSFLKEYFQSHENDLNDKWQKIVAEQTETNKQKKSQLMIPHDSNSLK